MARRVKISALGHYVPPRLLTNFDLEKIVDTTNEWILERTGIVERHIVSEGMATSDMAVEAAREAIAHRGIDPNRIEAVIVSTVTPDMLFPSTCCLVQHQLGIKRTWGFDLIAACCGFLYALNAGRALVEAGTHDCVLVIGSDTMSSITDYTDRTTCVLFGDAAGAVLLEPAEDAGEGIIDSLCEIDGSGAPYLNMPAGGSRHPPSHETVDKKMHYVYQDGQQVFKFAVRTMYDVCKRVLARNGLTGKDVSLMVPHQANGRIITATADRLGLGGDRVILNISQYGNTTTASIPLALHTAIETGRLKKGDLILLAAVGAGYTAGATLVRWAI